MFVLNLLNDTRIEGTSIQVVPEPYALADHTHSLPEHTHSLNEHSHSHSHEYQEHDHVQHPHEHDSVSIVEKWMSQEPPKREGTAEARRNK